MPSLLVRSACAVALLACSAGTAAAQLADKRTFFTFSGPITVPGVTLPAGKYLFRLVDPFSGTRVVQVASADGSKSYALLFALPAERPEPASQPEVRFMETAAGAPMPIKTWWYPGERTGFEFIYPKEQARRLAQAATQPVLTTQANTTTVEQTNATALARVSASGQETQVDASSASAAAAPGGESLQGEVASSTIQVTTPAVPAAPAAASAAGQSAAPAQAATSGGRQDLPKTASPVPIVAALGGLALASGAAMRLMRR